uniref:Ig-like domain-containing protein n=1 Tax=Xiphophorus maculatus TaxID=8083 RepID=A0A3B5PZR0_XIPMA
MPILNVSEFFCPDETCWLKTRKLPTCLFLWQNFSLYRLHHVLRAAASVLLPCRTRKNLPGDVRVEWRDRDDKTVHVYQNGSDQPGEQNRSYRTRTKMEEDPLRTGDLSLTLRRPTDEDSNIYTCSVSKGDGDILMKKQVKLQVKGQWVMVTPGGDADLQCQIPGAAAATVVEWTKDDLPANEYVFFYRNGRPYDKYQHQAFRGRVALKNRSGAGSGDVSLVLKNVSVEDRGTFRCRQWVALLPCNKKVLGSIPGPGSFCTESACSPCACWVLSGSPASSYTLKT